jgi:hypothetical protein
MSVELTNQDDERAWRNRNTFGCARPTAPLRHCHGIACRFDDDSQDGVLQIRRLQPAVEARIEVTPSVGRRFIGTTLPAFADKRALQTGDE